MCDIVIQKIVKKNKKVYDIKLLLKGQPFKILPYLLYITLYVIMILLPCMLRIYIYDGLHK